MIRLDCVGLDWTGLDWTGLDWTGSIGLTETTELVQAAAQQSNLQLIQVAGDGNCFFHAVVLGLLQLESEIQSIHSFRC